MATGDFNNIPFIEAKHYSKGRKKPCSIILIHYTAQKSIDETVEFFQNSNPAKASAHFAIERDLYISKRFFSGMVQMVGLSDRAHHAGRSEWLGRKHCNHFSVGIELCNLGYLKRKGNGFVTWNNKPYPENFPEPVFHNGRYWQPYTSFQYYASAWLCSEIMKKFPHISPDGIIGHEDVAPNRKSDPGPAFDWQKFHSILDYYLNL